MSYKIKLLQETRLDIKEIMQFYDEENPGLGKRFYESLKSRFNYIQKYPFHCQVTYRDSRNILVVYFPYQVHYRIEEADKFVIVFAVTHTSRNPKFWKKKR